MYTYATMNARMMHTSNRAYACEHVMKVCKSCMGKGGREGERGRERGGGERERATHTHTHTHAFSHNKTLTNRHCSTTFIYACLHSRNAKHKKPKSLLTAFEVKTRHTATTVFSTVSINITHTAADSVNKTLRPTAAKLSTKKQLLLLPNKNVTPLWKVAKLFKDHTAAVNSN